MKNINAVPRSPHCPAGDDTLGGAMEVADAEKGLRAGFSLVFDGSWMVVRFGLAVAGWLFLIRFLRVLIVLVSIGCLIRTWWIWSFDHCFILFPGELDEGFKTLSQHRLKRKKLQHTLDGISTATSGKKIRPNLESWKLRPKEGQHVREN